MPTTQESNKNPEYLYMYFRVAFNPLHFIASIWCANPTIDSRFRLSQTLKLQHTQLLAVVWTKVMEFRAYSRVLNKRTGRLLENEKKSRLYALIWDYSFINFEQKVPPIRLFPPILLYIFELFHCLIFGITKL